MDNTSHKSKIDVQCSHCGDHCEDSTFALEELTFCCNGCMMVYQLLHENGMNAYYKLEQNPGVSQKESQNKDFDYLDDENIVSKLLLFNDGGVSKIKLHLPQIHCSACLWLLENIAKLDAGIISSRVNFQTKEASISFRNSKTSLKEVVHLLTKIGYPPSINYGSLEEDKKTSKYDKELLYKLGLAGFSFGNIMLLSFPEYLGFDKASYLFYIGYINIILATPVLFYSGIDYIKSAIKGLKIKHLNIDLPIALGMITLYVRSIYEIVGHHGEGYMDSFSGFVFFLLIGRWFQSFTYQALDFERNYKSYFPISVIVKTGGNWVSRSIDNIVPGDIIRIKNQELIPADAVLEKGRARIDYSFVTGESDLITKNIGDTLFAGGRHQGENIELTVTKKVDQSYLTQLWNEDTFKTENVSTTSRLVSTISKYFTIVILTIAAATALYWYKTNPSIVFDTFTAVLIVACPCALALAIPFTYGNILRLLSRGGLFLRNINTIEDIQDIEHIVFDKTGTLTDNKRMDLSYHGLEMRDDQKVFLKSACLHSSHPLSKAIVRYFDHITQIDIDKYEDEIGFGFTAEWKGNHLKVGSSAFIFGSKKVAKEKGVFIELEGKYLGYFQFDQQLRANAKDVLSSIKSHYDVSLLSGDSAQGQELVTQLFDEGASIHFEQKPKDKLDKINEIQQQGKKIMMIGDGLNDAGALKQSNVGLVISDSTNNFSPACDGILEASYFGQLQDVLRYLRFARYIIYGAFTLAFFYNSIGLYFAITGQMSPVIAAILMPLSSVTVIMYGVSMSYFSFRYFMKK